MSNASSLNPGIKWGLTAGVAAISVHILTWELNREFFFGFVKTFIITLLILIGAVVAVLGRKRELGGQITFKEALKSAYLVFVIGGLFMIGSAFVYSHYVDPTIPQQQQKHDIEASERGWRALGREESAIEKEKEEMLKKDYSMSASAAFMTYLNLIILYFLPAVIIAFVLKSRKS